MPLRLDHLNERRNPKSLGWRNAFQFRQAYIASMGSPTHDWYLKEWLKALQKKQADIARDLDWNKARVSLMIRGQQQYTRDAVNELATYLNIRPYELLMHPDDAMRLRRLREDAIRIAHESEPPSDESPGKKVSLG